LTQLRHAQDMTGCGGAGSAFSSGECRSMAHCDSWTKLFSVTMETHRTFNADRCWEQPQYQAKQCNAFPVFKSHTFKVRSSEAEMACPPSGVTATARTRPVWPSSVCTACPLFKSHTFKVRSSEAEMACPPSGTTATARTWPVWPSRVRNSGPAGGVRLAVAGFSQGADWDWAACERRW